jgi:Flp pilus assembly protein CpaB
MAQQFSERIFGGDFPLAVAPAPARPRPGGGRLFIIVGLVLAVLAGAGVFFLGGVLGQGGVGGPKQELVVALTNIPPRAAITKDDLTTETVSGVFINGYTKTTDVVGLVAQINITKGAIITSDMLVRDVGLITATAAPAYLPLASGYVAITVPTSEQQGVAGHITVGDYITMIASVQLQLFNVKTGANVGPPQSAIKTIFTNLRVIGVGPAIVNVQPASGTTTTTNPGAVGGVTSSLTLEVTQCDAEYLVWFLGNSTLRYTLESFHDYLNAPTQADPNCPNILAAHGVTAADVDKKFGFTKAIAGG